jgi:deoxyribonuclease V
MWPGDADSLTAAQQRLAEANPEPWRPPTMPLRVGGCWVTFARGLTGPGGPADPVWTAAVTVYDDRVVDSWTGTGMAAAPYVPGLLALRLGRLMERAVRGLSDRPAVLLVDAGGRDHPRGAGLALQLGAVLDLPTVGVTHRPLLAEGGWPEDRRDATSPLRIGDQVVACWMRTRVGSRPLVVHPGWAVDLDAAVEVVALTARRVRTPEPLRQARQFARTARAAAARTG